MSDGCCGGGASGEDLDGLDDPAPDDHRSVVRERYAGVATGEDGICCGGIESERLGYDPDEAASVAAGADLGLGCGNPKALADMAPGETVLDLGSGAGFDCFLAAEEVGPDGQVIGVDMTPEMVSKARENVERNDASTVEFRLGEIEHLPVADEAIDVVISNCVVNLSPAKGQVFAEAFRVLRPGGRLAISDVVQTAPFPEGVRDDPEALAGCLAGAESPERIEALLDDAGFEAVAVSPKADSTEFISEWDDAHDPSEYLVSATIEARKPDTAGR